MTQSLFEQLGPAIARELGHRRGLVTEYLIVDEAAPRLLAERIAAEGLGPRVVLLQDSRTAAAAGDGCLAALRSAGLSVHVETLADREGHGPVCDDVTQAALTAGLPPFDVLVGVGSGVVSDLAKWVAFVRDRPAAVLATAASMNGYTAANVAPTIDGVKSLFAARAHRIVAASPSVLASAPPALTTAGLGDVIAKWVSTADWRMNERLFGEAYSEAVAGIIDGVERAYLDDPQAIAARDPRAIEGVFLGLVYSGCAMTLQGSSMPASGGEHLISHALDMRADAEHVAHDLHGRQVGVGTLFVAALYGRVLSLQAPSLRSDPLRFDRQGWGAVADAVVPHHDKQTARMQRAAARLAEPGVWQGLVDTLRPMLPTPARIKRVLRDAGAAHRIADLGIDRERFLWAVLNGAQMRERFTSLDLAWVTGVLPDAADAIVDEWLQD